MNNAKLSNNHRKIEAKHRVLRPYIKGRVLHLGCIGPGISDQEDWLHRWLTDHSEELVGIDTSEEDINIAQRAGYDCRIADVQDFRLEVTFDTVLATNIIEHLRCPGAMLNCVADHLKDGGRLVITTPRTFTPQNMLRELKGGIGPTDAHVCWYCRSTLENLLARCGYRTVEYEPWGYDRVGVTFPDKIWRTTEKVLSKLPGLGKVDKYQHLLVAVPEE